ncbi:HAMP domain-containing sensor histidine kinase [Paraflavisolibacter sp. H34]|uniref:HAMP domain-containing sensor histidine kinase n=1 Tax=Huijunlia imazamoxiresistens TaxID=3127457 RepID=UPI00301B074B
MKIQTKIALLFTLVCTLMVIVLSGSVFYFANATAFQDFYTRLELRATIAAKASLDTEKENTAAFETIRNEHLRKLPEEKEFIAPLDSLPQLVVAGLDGIQVPARFFNNIVTHGNAVHRTGYHFFKGIRYHSQQGDYAIIISAHHTYARNFLLHLKTILVTANLICTVIFFTVGLLFSQQILAPIRKITQGVKKISATSLHKRLPVREGTDEIAELGSTFNNMLSRLETSFETQNNFVSNASHELNTPLTTIIGEAEYALAQPRSPEQYREGIGIMLSQAEKLKNITRSLLELAQSGFTDNLSLETVDVNELLQIVLKVAYSIYPQCNLVTDYSLQPREKTRLTVQGNFHLLELCISNIVLNACKYSSGKNGPVTLAVATSDTHVIFIVKDKGIGIPEQDMPHIFDPFFRASNARRSKGYGIGLPLAQNIIRLHSGTIHVASKEAEGTEVVVKIPRG